MGKLLLIAPFLMLLSCIACDDSGAPNDATGLPMSDALVSSGPNGTHTGEIWITDNFGTERFNLQTGETVEVSDSFAYPSKDGSIFVEVLDVGDRIPDEYCQFTDTRRARTINIKAALTSELINSIKLRTRVSGAVRVSPDARRLATFVSNDDRDCGDNLDDFRLTVFSALGEQIYRDTSNDTVVGFDWLPDARLIVLAVLPEVPGENRHLMFRVETAPGTNVFTDLFDFFAPPEVAFYMNFSVNRAGTHGVMEAVSEKNQFLSGVQWRDATVHYFPLFEGGITGETNLFEYPDKTRVNAPTFSPDGQHILVTEGYLAGAFVSESHFPEIGVNETLLDIATRVPVKSDSTSYIVPADMKLQTMPPEQYSETMRPVLVRDNGRTSAVGLNPIHGLSWTPVVD